MIRPPASRGRSGETYFCTHDFSGTYTPPRIFENLIRPDFGQILAVQHDQRFVDKQLFFTSGFIGRVVAMYQSSSYSPISLLCREALDNRLRLRLLKVVVATTQLDLDAVHNAGAWVRRSARK